MNDSNSAKAGQREPFHIASTLRLLVLLVPMLLVSACATTGGGATSGAKNAGPVVKRAEERWDAVLANDFEKAYEYYSPGFRSSQTRGEFELAMRLRKVQFSDAVYQEQSCETDVCTLKFRVGYQIASPVPGLETWESKTTLEEKWVRTQGQWWYYPDN